MSRLPFAFSSFAILISLLSACTPEDDLPDGQSASALCPDGFPRGGNERALAAIGRFAPSPEGVAVCPSGQVFVARDASGEIWRMPLDGSPPERWAQLPGRRLAGLTCDAQERLFVAVFASDNAAVDPVAITLIAGRNAAPMPLPQPESGAALSSLNGILAVPGVGVYATDTLSGRIVLARETAAGAFQVSEVARDVLLGNGLAYHAGESTLYAAASGAFAVLRYAVGARGTLTQQAPVPIRPFVLFIDGIAVDERAALYIADYLGGRVVEAQTGATVARVESPASLAFRGGRLLITDYKVLDAAASGGLYAVNLGRCGGSPASLDAPNAER